MLLAAGIPPRPLPDPGLMAMLKGGLVLVTGCWSSSPQGVLLCDNDQPFAFSLMSRSSYVMCHAHCQCARWPLHIVQLICCMQSNTPSSAVQTVLANSQSWLRLPVVPDWSGCQVVISILAQALK